MTPSALTPAARGTAKKPPAGSAKKPHAGDGKTSSAAVKHRSPASSRSAASTHSGARSAGHPSEVRRPVAPRTARRVSGPLGGLTRGRVQTAPSPAPARPRVSSPKQAPAHTRAWPVRSAAYVRALPDHALLDRIIRGRAWIPLLGVLLAGIVAMQVEVLKLNAGIGRSLDRASALQGENQLLRASVSQLSDEQRVERLAAAQGMVMATPAQIQFLRTGPAIDQRALTSIQPPDVNGFAARLASADGAAAVAASQAAANSSTPSTAATSSTPSTAGSASVASTSGAAVTTGASTGAGSTGTAVATPPDSTSAGTTQSDSGATQSASTPPPVAPTDTSTDPAGSTGAGSAGAGSTGTGSAVPAAGAPSQGGSAGTTGGAAASGGVSATPSGG